MNNSIEKLTQLNAEIEGLLHVLSHRDTKFVRENVQRKYEEYISHFSSFLEYLKQNPIEMHDEVAENIIAEGKHLENELAYEEVKEQEAVSGEVEDEMDRAEEAISSEEPVQVGFIDEPSTDASNESQEISVVEHTVETQETIAVPDSANLQDPVEETTGDRAEQNDVRVDEMLSRRGAVNLKSVFTLNDKFRFRRSLFSQNDAEFAEALDRLADIETFDGAKEYLVNTYGWDLKTPEVEDFLSIIKPHYAR